MSRLSTRNTAIRLPNRTSTKPLQATSCIFRATFQRWARLSPSTTTMCPTPSSTRFFSTSLPKAPHPTTITWAAETRCCSKHFIILSILASLSSSRPPCRFLSVRPSLRRSYIHHLPGESGMVWNQADSPTHTGSYPLSHR